MAPVAEDLPVARITPSGDDARRTTMQLHAEELALVGRMRAGDEAAFTVFTERYVPPLFRFTLARLRGDRDLAGDIAQTALCKALAHLDSFRGEASLLTWLCSCSRNEILMHLRRPRRALVPLEVTETVEPAAGFWRTAEDDPERDLLRGETAELVHLCLDLLPERYARALEWKYVERMSVAEVGERLGLPPKAAESLLARARQAFRAAWERLRRDAVRHGGDDDDEGSLR